MAVNCNGFSKPKLKLQFYVRTDGNQNCSSLEREVQFCIWFFFSLCVIYIKLQLNEGNADPTLPVLQLPQWHDIIAAGFHITSASPPPLSTHCQSGSRNGNSRTVTVLFKSMSVEFKFK